MQFGWLVVLSVMFGSVIEGRAELTAATHAQIAESSIVFQLPESRCWILPAGTPQYGAAESLMRIGCLS